MLPASQLPSSSQPPAGFSELSRLQVLDPFPALHWFPIPAHDLAPRAPHWLQVPQQFSALARLQELVIQSAAKTTSVAPCVFSLPELRRLKLEDMANVRQHSPCLTGLARQHAA